MLQLLRTDRNLMGAEGSLNLAAIYEFRTGRYFGCAG